MRYAYWMAGIAKWSHSFYVSSYSATHRKSLNTAWLVMDSSYLRNLRERPIDGGRHHTSVVKQNLCCLLCLVCLHNCLIVLVYIDIIMAGTHSSSCLFWCRCQHNYCPLYNKCACSDWPSWWLSSISVIFQAHLGASCLGYLCCVPILLTVAFQSQCSKHM